MSTPASLVPEYEAWMERVCATHDAITYTCHHRLGNRSLAAQVSAQVLAGLLAKPKVFRYFGLPYSGRIARLAAARLASRLRRAHRDPSSAEHHGVHAWAGGTRAAARNSVRGRGAILGRLSI